MLRIISVAHAQTGDAFVAAADSGMAATINTFSLYFYWFLVAVMVIFIVMAVGTYMTAYGDPEVAKKGTRRLFYAVIALAVAVGLRVLVSLF